MEELNQINQIQEKVKQRQYLLTSHAEQEREADRITVQEIEEALLSSEAELIENYREDVRGKSCLVLGFTSDGSPLHLVCGLGIEEIIIITVYRPEPKKWIDWRLRRE